MLSVWAMFTGEVTIAHVVYYFRSMYTKSSKSSQQNWVMIVFKWAQYIIFENKLTQRFALTNHGRASEG